MNVSKTKDGFAVDIGGMWEGTGWEIQLNAKISSYCGGKPCPHCGPIQVETHTRYDKSTYDENYWICPRVVEAMNEGGHDSTGVCLDCILEAAQKLPPKA